MPLLLCPNCNASMQSVQRSGVELDMCPTCRGVWLDRGELEKILEAGRENQTVEHQAREAFHSDVDDFRRDPQGWQQRHPYDAAQQRYRYDNDHDHYRHGYRKKKRFDIFDIFD